jgi:hypothetical protein
MSDDDIEPLSQDLRDVVVAARSVKAAPLDGKARVKARLDATVFGNGGGGGDRAPEQPQDVTPSSGATAKGSRARIAAAFLGGVVVGGTIMQAARPERIVEKIVMVEREAGLGPTPRDDREIAPPVPSVAPVAAPDATTSVQARARSPLSDSLSAERTLLDPARTALGRSDGESALAAVRTHEQRFPTGQLTEEREAIAVQALVLLGRKDEARIRGERFLTRYPGSVLTPSVKAALGAAR